MEDIRTITIPMTAERNNYITRTINGIRKNLLSFIKQRVNNAEDAEDILQDVFYQFAGNTEPIEQVTGWLYKVTRNKITDSYRKQKLPLADDLFGTSGEEDDMLHWKEFLIPGDSNPETNYLRNLFWEALQMALDELPKEQRDVFIKNEMEGIPFKELEQQTGVSVATLLSRKRYAVLHLRNRLATLKDELLNY